MRARIKRENNPRRGYISMQKCARRATHGEIRVGLGWKENFLWWLTFFVVGCFVFVEILRIFSSLDNIPLNFHTG